MTCVKKKAPGSCCSRAAQTGMRQPSFPAANEIPHTAARDRTFAALHMSCRSSASRIGIRAALFGLLPTDRDLSVLSPVYTWDLSIAQCPDAARRPQHEMPRPRPSSNHVCRWWPCSGPISAATRPLAHAAHQSATLHQFPIPTTTALDGASPEPHAHGTQASHRANADT